MKRIFAISHKFYNAAFYLQSASSVYLCIKAQEKLGNVLTYINSHVIKFCDVLLTLSVHVAKRITPLT
jgi:hypothetical protein